MKKKTLLITGGMGFIGSNFIDYIYDKYQSYSIVNLDALTYAADTSNLNLKDDRYTFVKGDIRNKMFLESVFEKYKVTDVIHFAAESHVDNSIANPIIFAETNVMGTLNLIETARNFWQEKPFKYKEKYKDSRFHHISTDEVFGTLEENGFFTEESNYLPNSPYSSSKASSDLIIRSYKHTYGLNTVTTNCSNNYGEKQHDEKLIPTIIRNALNNKEIPIYGNGRNVRDWLYVKDHCKAIDLVFHNGKSGDVYLIGGNNEKTNIEVANTVCSILDRLMPKQTSHRSLIHYVEDRHGHDFRYAIDNSKIRDKLSFMPEETFETGILRTVEWYIEKYKG
ncbi:dTDP-glucose 4,6-dehydratase [Planomicrobium okeanokoites]|uniref:dTDP-glucose 4,6-dehydratase n=1 Tax=Planomicrobium okeanokoites TaxID=244 RepID=UPI0030FCBFE2